MNTKNLLYEPRYGDSWAVVIGINSYPRNPLRCACNDAQAFAAILEARFEFPRANISLLLDEDATHAAILHSFAHFIDRPVGHDDRVVFFFAGHGCTRARRGGEFGFLVPVDGDVDRVSTLVPWDALTRDAEMIAAKHVLFLVDACYGGLAVLRVPPPGASRFARDMMGRYARQVISSGKADELVADAGGPRAGHSIFTGHLLDGLEGGAASHGVVSGNLVMQYVHGRVGMDAGSRQTPHYGTIQGDGDFIFTPPIADEREEGRPNQDIMIQIPATAEERPPTDDSLQLFKDYLSEPQYRIRLYDVVTMQVRVALERMDDIKFPLQAASASGDEFSKRLRQYEEAIADLQKSIILLARWGDDEQQVDLERIMARLGESNTEPKPGHQVWLGLRWYPLALLIYSGGMAALSSRNYRSLSTLMAARVALGREMPEEPVLPLVTKRLSVGDMFKKLPGHERYHAPRSEYLFVSCQAVLDDLLFLGKSYESLFDRFEVFQALVHSDLVASASGDQAFWGPPGRFAWKHQWPWPGDKPYDAIVREAEEAGESWMPLKAGLFHGRLDRFRQLATRYREGILDKLHW